MKRNQKTSPLRFPRDEASHFASVEWWYYSGHLTTTDGRPFGFHCAFFLNQLFLLPPVLSAHCAISDLNAGTFHWAEGPGSMPVSAIGRRPLSLTVGDWRTREAGGVFKLRVGTGGYTLDLEMRDELPGPILHGSVGQLDYGSGGMSWYYSRPRLQARGTITCEGMEVPVTGTVWLDHQWGEFVMERIRGWDWFGLHFSDGRSLMLYLVYTDETDKRGFLGTLVAPDGTQVPLDAAGVTAVPLKIWRSPHSGRVYPLEWHIRVPTHQLEFRAHARLEDCELRPTRTTGLTYWEGSLNLQGAQGPAGQGYGEFFRRA